MKTRIANLKVDLRMLGLALKHPRTPWYAKLLAIGVVAYAISPIDLIPDPIPILGYLDDAVLLPLGIWLVVKLIPADVLDECRRRATQAEALPQRLRWLGAVLIVTVWLFVLIWAVGWGYRHFGGDQH